MPRPNCVACRSNNRRGKLLRCLHAVCVECVKEQIGDNGDVACPECGRVTPASTPGVWQMQSLPDSDLPAAGAAGGQQQHAQQQQLSKYCDECAEDTDAVATCSDCNDYFCVDHAKVHPTSRRTYKHKVVSLSDQAAAALSSEKTPTFSCPVHPTSKQSHYCSSCNKLLCDKCVATKHHEDHHDQVQPIRQAAAEIRKSLSAKMTSVFAEGENHLEMALAKAESTISGLQDEMESVSAQVNGFFVRSKKVMDKRQKQLLDQVDTFRAVHLLPVEQQKQHLLDGLSSGQAVKHLIESSHDDVNFLKMAMWLEETASDVIRAAGTEVKAFNPGTLAFTPCFEDEMTVAIATAGVVEDIGMLSSATSSMACPATVAEGDELLVSIEAKNMTASTLSVERAHLDALKVEIVANDSTATVCPVATPTAATAAGAMVARYKATGQGRITVSATTQSRHHLRGSPATVSVVNPHHFDRARCHGDIRLHSGDRIATVVGTGSTRRSVCCAPQWAAGRHKVSVRIDCATHPSNHMLFVCNADEPNLNGYHRGDRAVFGWYGYDTRRGAWQGGALGQPWQGGDVVHLTLDCDEHTLTGRHERTGATETLANVTGPRLYLYAIMLREHDQVTIL